MSNGMGLIHCESKNILVLGITLANVDRNVLSLLDSATNLQQGPCYISQRTVSTSLYTAKLLLWTCSTFSKLLVVSVGMSKLGKTNMISSILELKLITRILPWRAADSVLPVMREIYGKFFILQQDSARAHRTRDTISLLKWEIYAFISPDLCPPPTVQIWTHAVGYRIWVEMQQWLYGLKFITLMYWSRVWSMSGVAWSTAWSITQ